MIYITFFVNTFKVFYGESFYYFSRARARVPAYTRGPVRRRERAGARATRRQWARVLGAQCMHARMYTRAYAISRTYVHMYACVDAYAPAHPIGMYMHISTLASTCMHLYARTCTPIYACMRLCEGTYLFALSLCILACICKACVYACMYRPSSMYA